MQLRLTTLGITERHLNINMTFIVMMQQNTSNSYHIYDRKSLNTLTCNCCNHLNENTVKYVYKGHSKDPDNGDMSRFDCTRKTVVSGNLFFIQCKGYSYGA